MMVIGAYEHFLINPEMVMGILHVLHTQRGVSIWLLRFPPYPICHIPNSPCRSINKVVKLIGC